MRAFLTLLLTIFVAYGNAQCVTDAIFSNDSTNAVCIDVDEKVRTIYSNGLPNHPFGTWPSNNPVDPQTLTYFMCAYPQKANESTSLYNVGSQMMGCTQYTEFGIGTNGIRIAPFGARWFVNPNTMEENRDWNVEPLEMFSMDFNNSHSNGAGEYHYHGIPIQYFTDSLGIDGLSHSPIVGYAADGFPIYYKYVYNNPTDPNSGVSSLTSGYTLKSGSRPGDGVAAPDGLYDGFYVEDYEYVQTNWPLDECNGRFGVTPEYPSGTYYYLMTDNWPYIPRCFYGTVIDNSFRIGPNCPESTADSDCSEEMAAVNEIVNQVSVTIAPNPSSDILNIYGLELLPEDTNVHITIYNQKGELYYSEPGLRQKIDVSYLSSGIYFLQIKSGDTHITRKLIIEK